ncbi:MAG: VOC family protein [Pseudonocardiaceae bacterium]
MALINGVNHVAILTDNLDRFVDFYTQVLEVDIVFAEDTPAFRHAILRTGPNSWLHPAQVTGNSYGAAVPRMFDRGHLDHLALTATSADTFEILRRRLVARNACDGTVDDLGRFHALWFEDPDGMQVELTLIIDPDLGGIHAPRPLVQ